MQGSGLIRATDPVLGEGRTPLHSTRGQGKKGKKRVSEKFSLTPYYPIRKE